jgi:GTPase SAR1 family protein
LKYVIVGDSAVGKSSLLVRLTDDRFSTTEPTLGVEFGSRVLTVGEEGKKVKVQCEPLKVDIDRIELTTRLGYSRDRELSVYNEKLL